MGVKPKFGGTKIFLRKGKDFVRAKWEKDGGEGREEETQRERRKGI